MAVKPSQRFSTLFFLLLALSPYGHASGDAPSGKGLPFGFINELTGSQKCIKTKGLNQLKHYLQRFGYLNQTHANANDDDFDDALESAIRTYQENFHIKPTGILDAATVAKMTTPRCGVPDIINGTNKMKPRRRNHDPNSKSIHTVAHYAFFPKNQRWPPSQMQLTYGFLRNTPEMAMAPVSSAFEKWASVTSFTFSRAGSDQNSDLVIGFFQGERGDGAPFDGAGRILAHAFPPTDGRFHYNADQNWSVEPRPNAFHLESEALHEIGHLLGLAHSSVETAVMHPGIAPGETRLNFDDDDIQGIRTLYIFPNQGQCRAINMQKLEVTCYHHNRYND